MAPSRLQCVLSLLLSLAGLPSASPSLGQLSGVDPGGSGLRPLPALLGRGGGPGAWAGDAGAGCTLGSRHVFGPSAAIPKRGLRLRGGQLAGEGFMGEQEWNDVDPRCWGPENDHDGWLKPGEEFSKIDPRLQAAGSNDEFTPEEYAAMGVEGACYDEEGNVQFVPPGYTLEEALQEIEDGCKWIEGMTDEEWMAYAQKLLDENWRPYVNCPMEPAFEDGGFEKHPERLEPAKALIEESAQVLLNMGYTVNERGNYVPPQDKQSREQEAKMRAEWDAYLARRKNEEELAMQAAGMDPSAARPVDPVAALVQQYDQEVEQGLHEQLEMDPRLLGPDGPATAPSGSTAGAMGQPPSGSFQAFGVPQTQQGAPPGQNLDGQAAQELHQEGPPTPGAPMQHVSGGFAQGNQPLQYTPAQGQAAPSDQTSWQGATMQQGSVGFAQGIQPMQYTPAQGQAPPNQFGQGAPMQQGSVGFAQGNQPLQQNAVNGPVFGQNQNYAGDMQQ